MKKLVLALSLALASAPDAFAKPADEMTEIRGDKPVTLRADRAYFLFRTSFPVSPVFLRIPTDAEMQAYDAARREAFAKAEPELIRKRQIAIARKEAAEAAGQKSDIAIPPVPTLDEFNFVYGEVRNAQSIRMSQAFETTGKEKMMLIEALPGQYVLYGLGYGEIFHTCLCLGTVSFTAKPGQIADLGTLFVASASEKSDIPELASETGFGPSMNGHSVTWSAAVRPATASTPVPPLLAGKPLVPANYRATGKFVAGFAFNVNRLAPIPGVLGYDRGNVLDLASNSIAPNQY
ncbi:hypothetical protein QH494_26010 [Sphingomonas sp. AR_OL41]|uniref:hypothetical protein n=1 Tax=Sphingomonas sp. AR_OL41 TaxID=3042729 RepID=UPI00247FAFB8|nr:hypothetical protein [Sphingomonas sp. AR_OL41]MDH7975655.1 hypothetical protein [Sphingomonas sp. AR_OL41]